MGLFDFLKKNKNNVGKNQDLPTIITKYGMRVSTPYGVYPQDIENVLISLEKEKAELERINTQLTLDNERLKEDLTELKTINTQLKFDMSLIEIPDTTTSQDFTNLNKLKLMKNKRVEAVLDDDLEIVEI